MSRSMNRRQVLMGGGVFAAGLALGRKSLGTDWSVPASLPIEDSEVKARLDRNENPYGPSERARRAMSAAFDEGCRYPGDHNKELKKLIAEKEGVTPEHVVLGAGSHEILRITGYAYGLEGGEIMTAHPTYEGLEGYANSIGAYVHRVPLDDDLVTDLNAMDRRLTQAIRLVFVCNPNNPTGTIVPAKQLRPFCEAASRRAVVLVDEAYHEFVEASEYTSMIDLVREGYNVIISRTFSKIHGLAGLRVGYAITRPDIASRISRFLTGVNINVLGLQAAIASYQDPEFQAFSRRKNAEAKSYLTKTLDELGHRHLPSHTNFVFFRTGQDIQTFRETMKKGGILVGRPFPPYMDWCRVSMGTMDEMKTFAAALREVTTQAVEATGTARR